MVACRFMTDKGGLGPRWGERAPRPTMAPPSLDDLLHRVTPIRDACSAELLSIWRSGTAPDPASARKIAVCQRRILKDLLSHVGMDVRACFASPLQGNWLCMSERSNLGR